MVMMIMYFYCAFCNEKFEMGVDPVSAFPTWVGEAKPPPMNGLGRVILAEDCFSDCAHAGLWTLTLLAVKDQEEGRVLTNDPI